MNEFEKKFKEKLGLDFTDYYNKSMSYYRSYLSKENKVSYDTTYDIVVNGWMLIMRYQQ